jgi:hypothetical protein
LHGDSVASLVPSRVPISRYAKEWTAEKTVGVRTPEGVGRALTLWGRERERERERRSWWATACCESGVASVWYQSLELSVYSGRKKKRKIL